MNDYEKLQYYLKKPQECMFFWQRPHHMPKKKIKHTYYLQVYSSIYLCQNCFSYTISHSTIMIIYGQLPISAGITLKNLPVSYHIFFFQFDDATVQLTCVCLRYLCREYHKKYNSTVLNIPVFTRSMCIDTNRLQV